MSNGVDMSKLFGSVIMTSNTSDLILKRMCYLYICNYAESQSDLALLAVNTLTKDCHNESPIIRGMALRSICSLRLANLIEYIIPPVRDGLQDASPYVRKTAVLGTVKLLSLSPAITKRVDFVDRLRGLLLRDRDPLVVYNCICALDEILIESGGLLISKNIAYHLLNKLREFSEWAQVYVLEVCCRYTVESEDELYDILNMLDDRLRHTNSALVFATIKLFLRFTIDLPDIHARVYETLKHPILTILSSATPDLAYAVLQHVNLLIIRSPTTFSSEYKQFFCRYNDPSYIKLLKLEALTNLANDGNYKEIVQELSEYVTDVDIETAINSINAIGRITGKVSASGADDIVTNFLLRYFGLEIPHVTDQTLIVMKDLVRLYAHLSREILDVVKTCLLTTKSAEAKVAIIWMLGIYIYIYVYILKVYYY